MTDFQVLVLDSTLNRVDSMFGIDAVEARKNAPGRYSTVAFAQASVPGAQRATVQGSPGNFTLAYWDRWYHGPPRA